MITIFDTDALIGMFFEKDPHYNTVLGILERLSTKNVTIYLLHTTLSEFALVATSKIGMDKTKEAVNQLRKSDYIPIDVIDILTEKAIDLYQLQTSKEESLFDCYVMTAAKKIKADCIFSFDKGYKKNGFLLVEDFLKQRSD